jgi:hypothetical protein
MEKVGFVGIADGSAPGGFTDLGGTCNMETG